MTTKEKIRKAYANIRRNPSTMLVGRNAENCLDNARTEIEWDRLESAGLVSLTAEPEQENYFDVYGHETPEQDKRTQELIDRWGCYCVLGEYRLTPDGEWERGDSVGMCVYKDCLNPQENCYVHDIMRGTIDALKKELSSRCPVCRKAS